MSLRTALRRFRRNKYEPLSLDELGVDETIIFAAHLLNNACRMATKAQDFDSLGNLSQRWISLASTINELSADKTNAKRKTVGFSGGNDERTTK